MAAIYYAMLAHKHTHLKEVWIIGSFLITASIVVHGLTASPLTLWLGSRWRPKLVSKTE